MIIKYDFRDMLRSKLIEVGFITQFIGYNKRSLMEKFDEELRNTMRLNNYECKYLISGRVAIGVIGKTVRKNLKRNIALIPDYICNVVEKALRYSGFYIEVYKTQEDFSIDREDLGKKLRKKHEKIGIVVLASIFGSQNSGCDIVNQIKEIDEDIHILLDDAQNLMSLNESCYKNADSVIFSFNKKNIPGYMGGVLCFNRNSRIKRLPGALQPLVMKLEANILGVWIKSFIRELYGKFSINGFEYSTCQDRIFYRVDIPAEISKLSAIFAMNYLSQLKLLEKKRKENWTRLKELAEMFTSAEMKYINTPLVFHSPYIPFESGDIHKIADNVHLPIKTPYSLFDDPLRSLRPNTYAFVNYPYKLKIIEK